MENQERRVKSYEPDMNRGFQRNSELVTKLYALQSMEVFIKKKSSTNERIHTFSALGRQPRVKKGDLLRDENEELSETGEEED